MTGALNWWKDPRDTWADVGRSTRPPVHPARPRPPARLPGQSPTDETRLAAGLQHRPVREVGERRAAEKRRQHTQHDATTTHPPDNVDSDYDGRGPDGCFDDRHDEHAHRDIGHVDLVRSGLRDVERESRMTTCDALLRFSVTIKGLSNDPRGRFPVVGTGLVTCTYVVAGAGFEPLRPLDAVGELSRTTATVGFPWKTSG